MHHIREFLALELTGYAIVVAALGAIFVADSFYHLFMGEFEFREIIVGLFLVLMAAKQFEYRAHFKRTTIP